MDHQTVMSHLEAIAAAPNSDEKGKAHEALVEYVFGCVPGCITERNIASVFGAEQIDVAVGNSRLAGGLDLMPNIFLVECKDWDCPVDSKSVGYFMNKLASRSIEVGVLIASNGITGDQKDLTYAHSLGLGAAPRGIKVLVVTTQEIATISAVSEFVELLHRRLLRAYTTGSVGAP